MFNKINLMNRYFFALLMLMSCFNSYAQSKHPVNYNFDMEEFSPGKTWAGSEGYTNTADTAIKHSGKMSLLIQQTVPIKVASASTYLVLRPDKYLGNEIEVRAWMKFENVKDFVALMVKVTDADGNAMQFKSL